MKSYQHSLFQTNSHGLNQGISGKQRHGGKLPGAFKKPIKLNVHACTWDAFPECLKTEHKQQKKMKSKELEYVPILVHNKGVSLRYAWDGQYLLLEKHLKILEAKSFKQFLKDCLRRVRLIMLSLFVPEQVTSNYMDFLKWKFVHRIFSSAIQVQSTQAMLLAIGIGAKRSLPSAAALNWVLKDGLGRLSKFIYSASLGSAFDADLKRVRFSTSVLFSLSVGVELLTLIFPQHFLLLATVANIGKSISLAACIATSSAIHRSFAVADNLGDVSAKSQIQMVCFDNIGLALAACLNLFCKNNPRIEAALPFVIYPFFTAMDLFAIYQGLKYVHLPTLNKARIEIIADKWIHSRTVPSTGEVSNVEGIRFFHPSGSRIWPLRIGFINAKEQRAEIMRSALRSMKNEDSYFLSMESGHSFPWKPQLRLLLCLHKKAAAADIVMGVLQDDREQRSREMNQSC
ncbi:protein root UVB sensitive 4 isoform X2 [Cryptomeria japonica]|uniref:protein root UVB sensitive 4 isoform X2 n=1 Tax=Cryptomeria japonica TaxID=3369 RepID=UPI0027DA5A26|nr:protein root UVB sensitive 4 isoform X2 [Cryptomeria japonica]